MFVGRRRCQSSIQGPPQRKTLDSTWLASGSHKKKNSPACTTFGSAMAGLRNREGVFRGGFWDCPKAGTTHWRPAAAKKKPFSGWVFFAVDEVRFFFLRWTLHIYAVRDKKPRSRYFGYNCRKSTHRFGFFVRQKGELTHLRKRQLKDVRINRAKKN